MRRTWGAVGIVAAALLVGACDNTADGTPTEGSPASEAEKPSQSKTGPGQFIDKAPKVVNPLDIEAAQTDPCSTLTKSQLTKFGGGEAGKESKSGGKVVGCTWKIGRFGTASIHMEFDPGPTKSGLGDMYAQNEQGMYEKEEWRPTDVDGYPGVITTSDSYAKEYGSCNLITGVRDNIYLVSSVSLSEDDNVEKTCDGAKNAAKAIISTIRGG